MELSSPFCFLQKEYQCLFFYKLNKQAKVHTVLLMFHFIGQSKVLLNWAMEGKRYMILLLPKHGDLFGCPGTRDIRLNRKQSGTLHIYTFFIRFLCGSFSV